MTHEARDINLQCEQFTKCLRNGKNLFKFWYDLQVQIRRSCDWFGIGASVSFGRIFHETILQSLIESVSILAVHYTVILLHDLHGIWQKIDPLKFKNDHHLGPQH